MAARGGPLDRSTIFDDVLFMPPWCGTPRKAELLTDYLMTISPPRPAGMHLDGNGKPASERLTAEQKWGNR